MTKLITYTVTFRTDQDSASEEIKAPSPQAALANARAIANDRESLTTLHFEPYSSYLPVDEIVVETADGHKVAEWLSQQLLLRLAAYDLLNALQKAVTALKTVPRFKVTALGSNSYKIAAEGARAITKAKGNPEP